MNIVSILQSTISMSIPLIIAGMGGVFATRSGMIVMGMEGFMLTGAFAGVFFSYITGDVFLAFILAAVAGSLMALLYGFLAIRMRIAQVICGVAMNMLITALTSVLLQAIFKNAGTSAQVNNLELKIDFPGLSLIPGIGDIFKGLSITFYLAVVFVIAAWYLLFRSSFGLRLRMVGENPTAASTLGIKVYRYKYIAMAICGLLGGIAGAYLSIDHLNLFVKDMVAGRGFIVVVILTLGKHHPIGIALGALLFGFAEAMQIALQQVIDISSFLIVTIPYLVTLLVLIFGVKHAKGPAGTGKFPEE